MGSSDDVLASFSHGIDRFAFQANISQRNVVDIYPLDPSKSYKINSSLVNHLDYEQNDFKASDVIFAGWCSNADSVVATTQSKRKISDNDEQVEEIVDSKSEGYFINGFSDGRVVAFSSNGKDIVNIIRNKDEIVGVATEGPFIWILDSDKCVKKLEYNKSKPIKTFHLVDGKDETITHFQLLHSQETLYLGIITENSVYIVDPSKRRPVTVANYNIFGAISCEFSEDGKYFIIANIDKIAVFDATTEQEVQTWSAQSEKLKVIDEYVGSLNVDGKITFYTLGENDAICSIDVSGSEAIDFVETGSNVLIAWLNVNEPNFTKISLDTIKNNKEIILNEGNKQPVEAESNQDKIKEPEVLKEEENEKPLKNKITKTEQNELSENLLKCLETETPEETILDYVLSDKWTEARIKKFVSTQIRAPEVVAKLTDIITSELNKRTWSKSGLLTIWLKWLFTFRNTELNSMKNKHTKKNIKHLKSSLKTSSDTLPILLGIQGKLEMLKNQANLRKYLQELKIQDEEVNAEAEIIDEEQLIDGNGEESHSNSEIFVDATEF
ncbi:hypothetical protein NCAS_0J02180 [Naumovozyma castellii]|uniref:Small-subunit processome Utp12 domain-containing protein n=1 Tax=Naumovozyma castellii TaxID=27288 RepID=G0VL08_NAUCA|nr:hypothetical protein NCAS_0J02180 [Naumovozyma castellii CBS 4309]CCC72197.1 hypothetical protein NCAS_0J02180 [Naumovozyma castellii CBS 4309]